MEYYSSTFHLLSFLCYKVYFCFVIHREMRSKFSSNISNSCSSFGGVRIIRKVNTFINTVRSSFYSLSKAETSEMITYSMFFVGCNTDLFLIQDSQVIAIDWGFSPQMMYMILNSCNIHSLMLHVCFPSKYHLI